MDRDERSDSNLQPYSPLNPEGIKGWSPSFLEELAHYKKTAQTVLLPFGSVSVENAKQVALAIQKNGLVPRAVQFSQELTRAINEQSGYDTDLQPFFTPGWAITSLLTHNSEESLENQISYWFDGVE